MKFCKCGAIMMPSGNEIVCRACGNKESAACIKAIKDVAKAKKVIHACASNVETLPITKIKCPKCGHPDAYYWTIQTRAGDEAETQFFRCTKCNHSWRKY